MSDKGLRHLRLPVNPEYDWNAPPEDQADYLNPLEVANRLADYSNESLGYAERALVARQRRARLRVDKKAALTRLDRIRTELLRTFPPPTADRKSNALLDAYVERSAFEHNQLNELRQAEAELQGVEESLELVEADLEGARAMLELLRDLADTAKTYLSYRKAEWQQHGRF